MFVGPLSPGMDREALHARFKHLAPIQVRFVQDWATGELTGVAAVECTEKDGPARAAEMFAEKNQKNDGMRVEASIEDVDPVVASSSANAVAAMLRELGAENKLTTTKHHRGGGHQKNVSVADVAASDLDRHTLESLACVPRDEAEAAVREYYKAAATSSAASATSSAKSPATMLRVILRRRRGADSTPTYAGFFRGLPLPVGPAERLERILETIDWKEMGNVRAASIKVENSFSLGMATKSLQKTGPFATPFAFKHGMGVWDGVSVLKKHKEVWDASMELLRSIDPDYHCTSIGFNKNFKGSPHRDEKDSGCQIATGFGAYSGGALRVYGSEGIIDVDTNQRWCRFDGRYVHEVLPFKGMRYSVIFYQLEPAFAVDRTSTEEGSGAGAGAAGDGGKTTTTMAPHHRAKKKQKMMGNKK